MSEKAMEPSISSPPPDLGLQLQKENTELKEKIDELKSEIRDRDTDLIGLKKTVEEYHAQMEKFSMTLGVRNNYATLLGEMEKLICVEDDVEILREQIRALKWDDKDAVGRAIVEGEKAVSAMKKKVIELSQEVFQLKAKRNIDKYKSMELAKETMKRFFRGVINIITLKFLFSRIKGVKNRGT